MKDNLVEQQIVKMNRKTEQSSGMFSRKSLSIISVLLDRPSMMAQLASLQRLKEVIQ